MFRFDAKLWLYPGDAGWHFITLPGEVADDIRARAEPRGFGSVRVEVTTGRTTWATSVFPDKDSGSFVLPIKKQVRQKEGIAAGDAVEVELRLADPE